MVGEFVEMDKIDDNDNDDDEDENYLYLLILLLLIPIIFIGYIVKKNVMRGKRRRFITIIIIYLYQVHSMIHFTLR